MQILLDLAFFFQFWLPRGCMVCCESGWLGWWRCGGGMVWHVVGWFSPIVLVTVLGFGFMFAMLRQLVLPAFCCLPHGVHFDSFCWQYQHYPRTTSSQQSPSCIIKPGIFINAYTICDMHLLCLTSSAGDAGAPHQLNSKKNTAMYVCVMNWNIGHIDGQPQSTRNTN